MLRDIVAVIVSRGSIVMQISVGECLVLVTTFLLVGCHGHIDQPLNSRSVTCVWEPHIGREILLSAESPPLEYLLQAGEVVLTFDDGPHHLRTPRILDQLADSCISAAFFLRGDQAARHRDLVLRIAGEGHTIGSHTHSHPRLVELDPDSAREEIIRGQRSIMSAFASVSAVDTVRLFRYTYLQSNDILDHIIDELDLIEVGANASGRDWQDATPEMVLHNIEKALSENGRRGIILLHDPFPNSDKNVELIIDKLKASGYKFVSFKVLDECSHRLQPLEADNGSCPQSVLK